MTEKGQLAKESELKENECVLSDPVLWYSTIYQNRNKFKKPPVAVPTYKESHPYRIVLGKLQGLSLSKKVSTSLLRVATLISSSALAASFSQKILLYWGLPFIINFRLLSVVIVSGSYQWPFTYTAALIKTTMGCIC